MGNLMTLWSGNLVVHHFHLRLRCLLIGFVGVQWVFHDRVPLETVPRKIKKKKLKALIKKQQEKCKKLNHKEGKVRNRREKELILVCEKLEIHSLTKGKKKNIYIYIYLEKISTVKFVQKNQTPRKFESKKKEYPRRIITLKETNYNEKSNSTLLIIQKQCQIERKNPVKKKKKKKQKLWFDARRE